MTSHPTLTYFTTTKCEDVRDRLYSVCGLTKAFQLKVDHSETPTALLIHYIQNYLSDATVAPATAVKLLKPTLQALDLDPCTL